MQETTEAFPLGRPTIAQGWTLTVPFAWRVGSANGAPPSDDLDSTIPEVPQFTGRIGSENPEWARDV